MVDKWVGKVAVVTGSGAGIGAAIFAAFVKNGINVVGLDINLERTEKLITEMGETNGKAHAYKCDISDQNSVQEAFKWIESTFDSIHILVNNAGIGRNVNLLDEDPEVWQKLNEVIDTNFRGLTQCTREGYRLIRKADDFGLIININSIAGHVVPFVGWSLNIYPATKFAVTALTETVRQELVVKNETKVRITSISPSLVDSEFTIASGHSKPGQSSAFAEMPALKPKDIADAVLFILSTPYSVNITELKIRPVGEKS